MVRSGLWSLDVLNILCNSRSIYWDFLLRWLSSLKLSGMINEKTLRIGFIGCGKMAQALAKGFIASGNKSIPSPSILFYLFIWIFSVSNKYKYIWQLTLFSCFFILKQGITKSENIIGSSPRIDSTFIEEFSVSYLRFFS